MTSIQASCTLHVVLSYPHLMANFFSQVLNLLAMSPSSPMKENLVMGLALSGFSKYIELVTLDGAGEE